MSDRRAGSRADLVGPLPNQSVITAASVAEARGRIRGLVAETECPPSFALASRAPGRFFLKTEFRQRTGSFKDRGSLNKLLVLGRSAKEAGVVAASAGNHAQALAHYAAELGIPCTIVMPETAPLIKVANTKRHGARVIQAGETLSDCMPSVERLVQREGLVLVHPFDDADVIAGQGTIGLELLEQTPEMTAVVVPIGGGGMISGIAAAVKTARPEVRIIGVEAEASAAAHASLAAGRIVHLESSETLADGIAVKNVGRLSFPVMRELVDEVVTVNEEEITRAIFFLLEKERFVVEGAGAASVAAVLGDETGLRASDTTVCVLSGGNIDMNLVSRIIDRALWADGRLAKLAVVVKDRPGRLNEVAACVAIEGANVLHIEHTRTFGDITVGRVGIELTLETRGRAHVAAITERLRELGHRVEELG